MPTVNCCPARRGKCPLHVDSRFRRRVQRPQAHKCCDAVLCFAHFVYGRCRNSTFAIVINLMATSWIYVPPLPSPLPASSWLACYAFCGCVLWLRLLSLRHFDCRRGSWQFHIDFCCVPLIEFLRCCSGCCFCSTKFFNQKKFGASLKPFVARRNVLIRSVHM